MKTQSYFLILLTFFPWILEAQPLADLSGMKVGDSVTVEVSAEINKDKFNKEGKLTYVEERSEKFSYSFYLLEKMKNTYRFRAIVDRFRYRFSLKYEGKRYHEKNEHTSFDTAFDLEMDERGEFMQTQHTPTGIRPYLDPFEFEFNLETLSHSLTSVPHIPQDSQANYSTQINPGGIMNHLNAIFIAQKWPIPHGSINAKILPYSAPDRVRLSGNIGNGFAGGFIISSNPIRDVRSPLSQSVFLDEKGNFYEEFALDRPTYLYLSYEDFESEKGQYFTIPIYLRPGDDLQFILDATNPQSLTFKGKDALKFQAFHDFFQKYLEGSHIHRAIVPEYKGLFAMEALLGTSVYPNNHVSYKSKEEYDELEKILETKRDQLGEEAYFLLKAEIIYRYAFINYSFIYLPALGIQGDILPKSRNAWKNPFGQYKSPDLYNLTLTENKEYYLDSLGLRLEEVEQSHYYGWFLDAFLTANTIHIKTNRGKRRNLKNGYHLARYIYKGFSLCTFLKGIILNWADHSDNEYPKAAAAGTEQKHILSEFKLLCNYKPYLLSVDQTDALFYNFEKGQPALDMKLSESESLKDYFGQKLALLFFRKVDTLVIARYNKLAKENPEVKFIFIYTSPYLQAFNKVKHNQVFQGDLFHSPGYGANEDRPYYIKLRQENFLLIDQDGKFWGSKASQSIVDLFEKEVRKLTLYQSNNLFILLERYKEQVILIVFSFSLFSMLGLIYWYVFVRAKRKKEISQRDRIETELRAIRSQMNPHFLFNSLSSVQNLINQAEPEKANHYLSRFSQLVRKVLNHSEQALIPLEEELKVVDLYCELEALRFKFDYKIEVDQGIDAHTMEIPSMLIQPYVENSVRHGLATQGGAGFIGVFVRKKEELIQIEIIDNGIGIRKHMEDFAGHVEKSGFGLRLSEERVQKINERYKMDIEVKIFDRRDDQEPSHGTRVVIKIPIEK